MSWKALKRFWPHSAEVNTKLDEVYTETNAKVTVRYGRPAPTEAVAIGYGLLASAKTRSPGAVHLIIGPYSLWPIYFTRALLKMHGINQKIVAVVPEFLRSEMYEDLKELGVDNVTLIRYGVDSDLEKIRGQPLASVYVCSYENMFNWEYYDLDLNTGGYIIFSDVDLPPLVATYRLPGWTLKGRYSNLYFLSRDEYENRDNDTDKGKEPESTGEDLPDTEE